MGEKNNQIFVGKKYEKFEKKLFSFPAFFFGGIYFAYRKMFVHGILLVLFSTIINIIVQKTLNFGLNLLASLCISVAIGLYFPIWYRSFYRKKVQKIQNSSSNLTEEQLIHQLQKNGGTSILFAILFIILSGMINSSVTSTIEKITLNSSVSNSSIQESENNEDASNQSNTSSSSTNMETSKSSTSTTLKNIDEIDNLQTLENVKINGFSLNKFSSTEKNYQVYISENEDYSSENYFICDISIFDLIDWSVGYDEIRANISYYEENGEKIIAKYNLYDITSNTEIKDLNDENSFIKFLGYYPDGENEDILTLVETDDDPYISEDNSYSSYKLVFTNSKNRTFDFYYKIYEGMENKADILKENNQYKVNFTCEERMAFDKYYTITDINEI